jgi:hypothetical protein
MVDAKQHAAHEVRNQQGRGNANRRTEHDQVADFTLDWHGFDQV